MNQIKIQFKDSTKYLLINNDILVKKDQVIFFEHRGIFVKEGLYHTTQTINHKLSHECATGIINRWMFIEHSLIIDELETYPDWIYGSNMAFNLSNEEIELVQKIRTTILSC